MDKKMVQLKCQKEKSGRVKNQYVHIFFYDFSKFTKKNQI